jgi:hypothetical protein
MMEDERQRALSCVRNASLFRSMSEIQKMVGWTTDKRYHGQQRCNDRVSQTLPKARKLQKALFEIPGKLLDLSFKPIRKKQTTI